MTWKGRGFGLVLFFVSQVAVDGILLFLIFVNVYSP